MTIAITTHYRDSHTTMFTDDYMVAEREWNKANELIGKDVKSVTGGIVCCVVRIGAGNYTYFSDKLYKHGTKLVVPTRYGNKIAPVIESKIITRQTLELIAKKNKFNYKDYKEIIGVAK